jgi:hypothetical protein
MLPGLLASKHDSPPEAGTAHARMGSVLNLPPGWCWSFFSPAEGVRMIFHGTWLFPPEFGGFSSRPDRNAPRVWRFELFASRHYAFA